MITTISYEHKNDGRETRIGTSRQVNHEIIKKRKAYRNNDTSYSEICNASEWRDL